MDKKILVAGLLVSVMLLVPINSAYSNIGIQIENKTIMFSDRGNTLFVGGNGSGNYTKIQDAINDASDGDTVFVYDDSSPYYENVVIDKSIKLIGENRDTTIVDGNEIGDVIKINASNVTINGFTIQNSTKSYYFGGGVTIDGDYNFNIISNNNIFYNLIGISLFYESNSNSNKILNNNVSYNEESGIYILFCDNTIIEGNIISNNGLSGIDGISLNISILNNIVFNNELNGIGLSFWGINCIISHNEVFSNKKDGIEVSSPIKNINFRISWNNVYCNSYFGINVWGYLLGLANNVEISHNNIEYNLLGGISLISVTFSEIKYNNIYHNNIDANFTNSFGCKWKYNYWGSQYKIIKLIKGKFSLRYLIPFPGPDDDIFSFPLFNIDWHPAKEPYDI